jgi:hypothetical protein
LTNFCGINSLINNLNLTVINNNYGDRANNKGTIYGNSVNPTLQNFKDGDCSQ